MDFFDDSRASTSPSGLDVIGDLRWGTHFCHFYHYKEELLDVLVPYFKAGLQNRDFCIWIRDHTLSEREIKEAMERSLPDFNKYWEEGQMEIIWYEDWFMREGEFDAGRTFSLWKEKSIQGRQKGFEGQRMSWDTFWVPEKDWKNFMEMERRVNESIGQFSTIANCTFSLEKYKANEILDIVANHQFALVKRNGCWEKIEVGEQVRIKAEEKIHHLASFPKLNPNPVFETDLNGNVIFFNEATVKVLRGAGLSLDPSRCLPDDYKKILSSLGDKKSFYREVKIGGKSFGLNIVPFRELGVVKIYTQEISIRKKIEEALRQSEARLNRSQEIAHLGSWELDLEKNLLTWSDEAYRIFGLVPQEFGATYEAFLERIHPEDRQMVDEAYSGSLARNEDSYSIQHRIVRKNTGEIRWVHEKCQHVRSAYGKILRSIGMVHDITEVKETEEIIKETGEKYKRLAEENEKLLKDIQEGDKKKDEFLAILAHELRNPLAPLLTSVQTLREFANTDYAQVDPLHELTGESIIMAERQVKNMARMLDDLLDVSRIIHGKFQLKKNPVDINILVRDAILACENQIKARSHSIRAVLAESGIMVRGDRVRLEQVVVNLLSNASKYMPGEGEIIIKTSQDNKRAIISVEDRGIGMSPEILPKIFDPFYRSEKVRSNTQGLGIGLMLTRNIVEKHGGKIIAQSSGSGQGSTFTVFLPLLKNNSIKKDNMKTPMVTLYKKKVLVVDDNTDAADALAKLLTIFGHEVRVGYDAKKGLEIARQYNPEVALLDIGLPGMDGYQMARALKIQQENSGIKLVAVSGYGQEEDIRKSREAGFDHHLVKPVDTEILRKLLAF